MGHITMPQVIVGAPRYQSIVIRNDDGNSTCKSAGSRVKSDRVPLPRRTTKRPAASLWFAATLVVLCLSDAPRPGNEAHAQSNGVAGDILRPGQAKTSNAGDARQAGDQEQSAETLARDLATDGAADVQKSLREERGRAARLEQDLAAARRDVETLTALAVKASDEVTRLKQVSQSGSADLQQSLEQERARAARLERDLVAARSDLETLATLAVKATNEAARLKQGTQGGSADLQMALEQELARTARLERDLAAARRDVEKQAALAAQANEDAAQLKQAAQSGTADLQKSLEQEHARTARLEQDLAAARRDADRQAALTAKAGEAAKLRRAPQSSGATDLRNALEREHARTTRLEQDLVEARRDADKQAALAAKANDDAAELKASQGGAADLRKALEQEHARTAQLEQDLATARRDAETQVALVAKANDDAAELKQAAQSGVADLQKALEQEHARTARLEQDLAAARRDLEAQTALAAKANDDAAELKRAAQSGAADLQKALEQEHARTARLEQDLAAARHDLETQTALTTKTGNELARLRQATEAGAAELRRSMQKEHERADALAQDLSMARTKIYAYEAHAARTNEAAQQKQAEANDAAELRQSLQRERQRAEQLARDLAIRSRERDAQAERVAEAYAQVVGLKQAAEQAMAEQRNLLQRERGRAEQLERDLASANRDIGISAAKVTPVASQGGATGATGRSVPEKPASAPTGSAEDQAAAVRTAGNAELHPDDSVQEARLMARARLLLERGDVGGARIVLERVAEMGSAQASFALAETYDPLILSSWRTYGTRGDSTKARDLYAKAEAGGIKEAKVRFEALRR
ncbi:hypothetical protein JQ607_26360 [Bradyrhizobium liaoningense]|uniref:hypothetical protein n=1 Tax=Bradyrhizobium liaoningense TaxID=43992 RepID=UPI001BAB0A69|nr:hypothetical protein [Bradyrhizobium liaoningense]MBR0843734.1 hypothetical protein [Bradyrhizobium liaoningense]